MGQSSISLLIFAAAVFCAPVASSETLVLSSGRTISGSVIRTNGNDLMLLTDYGTFNFGRDNIKEINGAQPETTAILLATRVGSNLVQSTRHLT